MVDSFFRRENRTWDSAKYARRKPLSAVVNREIRLMRAEPGSQAWKEGLLLVVDVESGETIATLAPAGFKDPATGWNLRTDC